MSDLKSCSRCGKIHARSYKCNVGRVYKKTDEDKLRSTWAWTKKAKQIKEDANGLTLTGFARYAEPKAFIPMTI